MGAALWGMHKLWAGKHLAYSSAPATCALLSRNRYIRVSCGFACNRDLCLEEQMEVSEKWACWGFRKVRLGTLPNLLCGVSDMVSIRMFCKGFIAFFRSYLVPTDSFTGEWFCSLPTGTCEVHDIVVQSPRHSTAPSASVGSYTDMHLPVKISVYS